GASFQVFRTATTEDTDVQIITSNGINYAVVPVTVNGENLILTTDDNGTATSPELLCDTYFLVETKAPFGYEPLDEAIPVTVKSNLVSTTEVLYIPNTPGSILPETGGAGTKWMIAIGSVVAMCTAALLITEKKMSVYR
ncbi:MAG: LPXTG cell wall anchor domain-containing protein, partial [Clostridia bacterium]|nr:LPXTG cell wall anchor domain-containing protein [Clostridia bacterium]